MKNKLIFLGTGSAKISLKRFHTSFIISTSNSSLLVDCGDGISRRLKEINVDSDSIENMLITHLHQDHFSGLATLVVQMKLQNRIQPLNLFIHDELVSFINLLFEQTYLFKERLPFNLNINGFDWDKLTSVSNEFKFTSKQNSHLNKYSGFSSNSSVKFISPSFLFNVGGKVIHYTSDVGSNSDLYLFDNKIDFSIVESTHIEMKFIKEYLIKKSPSKCFLVHLDEDKEFLINEFFKDEIFDGKVIIPDDGNEYYI